MLKDSRNQLFRPDLYLVARILYSLAEEGASNRSNLSVKTGLAYDRLINYLDWMSERNLVVNEDGLVKIAEKGLQSYEKLVSWIMEYVGKLNFPNRDRKNHIKK